ncbi:hypothetical protein PtA15_18A32 [Puccinia triticina]|uniref:Uncharacterized protein n=1 Tax=Puccinia triticina TaxID=208348 RepID=A0ABY7D8I5_9BASI|nr:uncharacterized protein PtA15_18A32 [Puccinia triticina]WAQ92977.1 hypothetical protein PtA15_18A32 [Puccinia triticina]
MAPTNAPLGEQPGAEGNGAPPSSSDESWIAALVDGLVPKFQANGSMQSGDSAMQTANEGKSSDGPAGSGTPATAPAGNVGSTSTSGPPANGHLDVQTGGSMNLDR